MWMLYHLGIYVIVLGIRISAWWNPKSRKWVSGRKNWFDRLQVLPQKSDYRIWFHVSSLGEFEQARPVIERIKDLRPGTEIILSFFSPSGYEQKRNYEFASVHYLPADLPGNAAKWINKVDPDFAVFVKYDLWPGYLKALSAQQIPAILISANWVPGRGLNSWANPLTYNLLKDFKMIFLQRGDHQDQFRRKGVFNIKVSGDTRIDRSLGLPAEVENRVPKMLADIGQFDLVAGSTWPGDEEILIEALQTLDLKTIIAPHDVTSGNIERLIKKIVVPSIRLSEITTVTPEIRVIVVDNIGLLSVLYALGRVAYIGGGFGKGIHNILEPMAHGKPVIFGPRYQKFPEALDMVSMHGAWSVQNKHELISILTDLNRSGQAEDAGMKAREYLEEKAGASIVVSDYILKSIPYIA